MDEEIDVVGDFKFIIIINKHIKWTSPTESIANKESKYIGATNILKHILPLHILRTVYNNLILDTLILWYTIIGK